MMRIIELLKDCWRYEHSEKYEDHEIREALEMAIKALERQYCEKLSEDEVVTWYSPKEKLPEEDTIVIATINGREGSEYFQNTFALLEWCEGWFSYERNYDELEVLAWCDLEPYKEG